MYQMLNEPEGSAIGQALREPKFPPGRLVATPGALALLEEHQCAALTFIARHLRGDWGETCPQDARLNDAAIHDGGRILSAYRIAEDARIWIITEADRSATTVLRPEEY